ncbi:hypothetical protein DYB32_007338 [Aphanomyces invadans]|uniref:Uncharacterized protein n=1 Tax=Aphanomyces invadans TaxID=157072 RepID=A0A3R6Y4T5_9STRA|nr:hypothetical protein DYB32_007338 [Aphanomyces invadans]
MVPSITSIVVVAAFVIHHIRHHDGVKARKGATTETTSIHAATTTPTHHSDSFGHGLTLRDVSNPEATIDFNSKLPIPINSALFQGFAYVLLRRPDGDPHWDPYFEGKQRTVWIMVQGSFKRAPLGTIYVAGELPRTMALTFWSKALVTMIVATIKSLLGGIIHFSFGDKDELPHLALPLYQSADTVIATPLDEVPPKLGASNWVEDPAKRAERKRTPVGAETFRTDVVYSFQFHTMHVDLAHWSLVNLPGLQNVSLTSLMGDMSLRLGVYEHTDPVSPAEDSAHITKEYCFSFDISSSLAAPSTSAASSTDKLETSIPSATAVEFEMWMWLETFDPSTERRPVSYLFRVLQPDGTPKTVLVSSANIIAILSSCSDKSVRLLTRARLDHYLAIDDQVVDINRRLHSVAAMSQSSAAYALLKDVLTPPSSPDSPTALLPHGQSPKDLGVHVWRWDLNVCMEGSCYRIVSDVCLRQEYIVLTSASLLVYRTYASQPAVKISVNNITNVTTLFVHDLHVVAIYTWTEVMYFHVSDPAAWQAALVAATDRPALQAITSPSNHKVNLSQWSPFNVVTFEGQLVLNHRKIAFDDGDDCPTLQLDDAVTKSAECVQMAVMASTSRQHRAKLQRMVHALRQVDLATLSTSDMKLVFLLNVYQALLVHASMALPFSTTVTMHQCAYEVGKQKLVLSLAEMEHVLMRAAAPQLTDLPYLDFVPEAASYPTSFSILTLPSRDFRVSLALHAHRSDKRIVEYSLEGVHCQLNHVVGTFLGQHVRVKSSGAVTLPLVCQWFQSDFGDHILRKTMGLLAPDTFAKVQDALDHPKFSVQFRDNRAGRVSSQWALVSTAALTAQAIAA